MKLLGKTLLSWGLPLALLVASWLPARAEIKPVVILSIASVEKTLADVDYLTKAAGSEDVGKTAVLFGNAYTNGFDKKRPAGLLLAPQAGGGDFIAIGFIPVSDLKTILATFKEQTGEPKDAGDGVLELAGGVGSVFVKEANGWAFIAQHKEQLAEAPADPTKFLGDMPKQYTLAARVLMQNLPTELKKLATDQIRIGFENSLRNTPAGGPIDRELMEKMQRAQLESLIQMIDELDEITVGFAVDPAGQRTFLDTTVTAVAGSRIAKQAELAANTKSAFAGFLMQEASVSMNFAGPVPKEDFEQSRALLEQFKTAALHELDNDPSLDAPRRAAAKELLGGFFQTLIKTMEEGKMDGGAALILEPKSLTFAVGLLVADGKAVESLLTKLADLAKDEPDAPTIKLNSGQHGGITLHTVTAPIPEGENDAREILGDKINLVVGTGPKALYVSFGKDAQGLLNKVIDRNAAGEKAVPTGQMNVALLPIMKFAASVDDNPLLPALVQVLEKSGKDKVNILVEPRTRGINYRFQIEEGVIQLIGEAAKRSGVNVPGAQF